MNGCVILINSLLIIHHLLLSRQESSSGHLRFRRGGSHVRHTNVEL